MVLLRQSGTSVKDLMVDPEVLRPNTEPGKDFPGGPICHFKGVDIPTLVCRSKSDGITPDILHSILQHYKNYIPRQAGDPIPACILNGHCSCFRIQVVNYIQNRDENNKVDPMVNHA